jgi:hypothetical protein
MKLSPPKAGLYCVMNCKAWFGYLGGGGEVAESWSREEMEAGRNGGGRGREF